MQQFREAQTSDSTTRQPLTVTTDRARQGVTGHNVRYVLGLGLAGVIIAFALIYILYFSGH
jgi:hypothetical protein